MLYFCKFHCHFQKKIWGRNFLSRSIKNDEKLNHFFRRFKEIFFACKFWFSSLILLLSVYVDVNEENKPHRVFTEAPHSTFYFHLATLSTKKKATMCTHAGEVSLSLEQTGPTIFDEQVTGSMSKVDARLTSSWNEIHCFIIRWRAKWGSIEFVYLFLSSLHPRSSIAANFFPRH